MKTVQESSLPLSAEVVSALSYVPVNSIALKAGVSEGPEAEPGFSNHKASSEQAKQAEFAGGSRKDH